MDFTKQNCLTLGLIFAFSSNAVLSGPSSRNRRDGDNRCITSCESESSGSYPSCNGCHMYVVCEVKGNGMLNMTERTCRPNKQWDNNAKKCKPGQSPTCPTGLENSQESTSTTTMTTSHQPTEIACSPSQKVFLEWLPCEYILLIAGIIGLLPTFICLLCKLCQARRKKQASRNMTPFTMRRQNPNVASVGTQIPESHVLDDGDSAIYDDLVHVTGSDNRYATLQYATGPNVSGNDYIDMQQRQNQSDTDYIDMQQRQNEYEQMNGNPYLELHGYSYLQSQDIETRKEIDRALAPIIVKLCEKYKNKPNEYIQLETELVKFSKDKDDIDKT